MMPAPVSAAARVLRPGRSLPLRPRVRFARCAWGRDAFNNSVAPRWQSTLKVEENATGHIITKPNEAVLFFDSTWPRPLRGCPLSAAVSDALIVDLFPLKLATILTGRWQADRDLTGVLQRSETRALGLLDPVRLVKGAIPDGLPIRVTEILPRLKDGGAFVKFEHGPDIDPSEIEGARSARAPYAKRSCEPCSCIPF